MRGFIRVPLKHKLNWIIMSTCGAALVLACVAFAIYEVISLKRSMPVDLTVLATIIGDNGKSALEFDDQKFAEDTLLASLAAQPHIMTACLFNKDGKVFAQFRRGDQAATNIPPIRPGGHYFFQNHLEVYQPIVSQNKVVGSVFLRSDLTELSSRLKGYGGICSLVLLAALMVAWMLSSKLQRIVSGPILELVRATTEVARNKNYSLRVTKQSEDELGSLFVGFNEMLTEIEERDAALQLARTDLELRVIDRTSDLTRANESLIAEVAERNRAESALRVSQQKFETLVNSIEGMVWEAEPLTFAFKFVSQQAEQLLGYPLEKWLSEPTFWQDHLHPDDKQRAIDFFHSAVAQHKSHHFEYRMVGTEGRVVWIRDSASVVMEGGRPALLRGVLLDITEQKLAEAELEEVNKRLLETSRQAGMAEVATGVLHNVGNVLNSVNVSANLVCERLRKSKLASLVKTTALLREREAHLGQFLTEDPKGKIIPAFLSGLGEHLTTEQTDILKELQSLTKNIEHIKDIVAMQQSYSRVSGVLENLKIPDLVEDALQINAAAFTRHGIQVVKDYDDIPPVSVDKHKVLQILINLLQNAKYAIDEYRESEKRIQIALTILATGRIRISIRDNGVGIKAENLTRMFSHGFTTRKHGHGFGLHSGALAAKEMGGSLTAHSDGPGTGATFVLELPLCQKSDQPNQEYVQRAA